MLCTTVVVPLKLKWLYYASIYLVQVFHEFIL